MCIEVLSKDFTVLDMRDVFHIIPESTINFLEIKIQDFFACQEALEATEKTLVTVLSTPELEYSYTTEKSSTLLATNALKLVFIEPTDLFSNVKEINEYTIQQSK